MGNKIKPIREIKEVPKRKGSLTKYFISAAVILGLGGLVFSVSGKFTDNNNKTVKPTQTKAPQAQVSATPTIEANPSGTQITTIPISPSITPVAGVPEVQVIYYGKSGNKMGFFVTNKEMQKYISRGSTSLNAYKGQILFDDGTYDMNFDFRNMTEVKVVMKSDDILLNGILPAIGNYRRNEATGMLYLVLNTVGNRPKDQINVASVLYRVDLYYGRVRRIMTHQIGVNAAQKGPINIMDIWHDDYVLLRVDNCINCTNKEPFNWVIANVNTYANKYLGIVSDVKENRNTGEATYRKLVAVKEACTASDQNCDALGEKTVYKPAALSNTVKLP